MLVQAVLSTAFLLISVLGKGTGAEAAYLVLLDTMLLVYFVPYLYLFLCYLKAGIGTERAGVPGIALRWAVGTSGLLVTLFAMVVACVPPPDSHYHLAKVVGGAAGFLLLGGLLYWRAAQRTDLGLREAA
jgi:L-asparagine transporter-like permease